MSIKRYDLDRLDPEWTRILPYPNGRYVRHQDHAAEVEQLRTALDVSERQREERNHVLTAEVERLEAEVERLRADNQALAYALRLAISGRPVRNADELLAKEG